MRGLVSMKKNVIILHTDQQRYDSLGCNGNKVDCTQNIDALAADGCNFSRHIAANPTCSPSRASLLTGYYTPGHGLVSNGIPLWRREKCESDKLANKFFGTEIEEKVATIADRLGDVGYKTALFGKLHLEPHLYDGERKFYESYKGWKEEAMVNRNDPYYGFQTNKIILGHGEAPCGYNRGHYGRWLNKKYPEIAKLIDPGENAKTSLPGERNDIFLSKIPSKYHNTMWLAEETCQYIEDNKEGQEPIFMFVGFPDPHHPFTPPEDVAKDFMDIELPEFADLDKIVGEKSDAMKRALDLRHASKKDCAQAYKNTMASIHLIDQAVGQIIEKLKKENLYDDTLIIYTSDHGDYLGDFDMLAKSDLPSHNLVRIPFIMKATKDMVLPKTMDIPMSNVDVMPTIFNLLGIETDTALQGVDIFDEKNKDNTPMVTCYSMAGDERNISLLNDTYRYTYYMDSKQEELYNHVEDIKEHNNLVNDPSVDVVDICQQMKAQLFEKHIDCHLGKFDHYALW